jgi:hypothetical protein
MTKAFGSMFLLLFLLWLVSYGFQVYFNYLDNKED